MTNIDQQPDMVNDDGQGQGLMGLLLSGFHHCTGGHLALVNGAKQLVVQEALDTSGRAADMAPLGGRHGAPVGPLGRSPNDL